MVHCPVFPYDSASYWWWFLLGSRDDKRAEERRHIRQLLAAREAIVLCGHTHKTELLDWYGDGGRITQMTMSSVWAKESQGTWTEKVSSPEGYGGSSATAGPTPRVPTSSWSAPRRSSWTSTPATANSSPTVSN